ncbi:hypothetical protein ACE6H2_019285 [Prunus campanulata]
MWFFDQNRKSSHAVAFNQSQTDTSSRSNIRGWYYITDSRKVKVVVRVDTWRAESSQIGWKKVRVSSLGTEVIEQVPFKTPLQNFQLTRAHNAKPKKPVNGINIPVTYPPPDLPVSYPYTVYGQHTVGDFLSASVKQSSYPKSGSFSSEATPCELRSEGLAGKFISFLRA